LAQALRPLGGGGGGICSRASASPARAPGLGSSAPSVAQGASVPTAAARHGEGGGYAPADRQGNFRSQPPMMTDDDTTDSSHRVDFDELEHDPSERRPGGPVAEAVRAAGPKAWQQKWMVPGLLFLAAFLLQSVGLHAATRRYVVWMDQLRWQLHPAAAGVDPESHHHLLQVALEHVGPRDNFAAWLGTHEVHKLTLDLVAGCVPFAWLFVVVSSKNLRLWTRTLLAGSILALLKGTFAWVTLVPDSSGWEVCQERLHPVVSEMTSEGALANVASTFKTLSLIIWLWIQDLLFGMRGQDGLVCPNSFSGPSYVCALFSLGLYDATRASVRKVKPHFRTLFQLTTAGLLSTIVVADACLDLVSRRQYTMDVTLALVLSLLVYGSPVVAICTDYLMTRGSPLMLESKEGCDVGDVVVPPCCIPFCCVHGRYFLYTKSAASVEESQRAEAEAMRAAEEFRVEQEEAARRLLQLEAQLEAVKQRVPVRERQGEADAERQFAERLAEARRSHEERLARGLAERRDKAAKAQAESPKSQRLVQLQARCQEERQRLESEAEAARVEAGNARLALRQCQERSERHARELEALRSMGGGSAEPAMKENAAVDGGDFPSAPAALWEHLHAAFPVDAAAAAAVAKAAVPVKAVAPVKEAAVDGGDFRSAPAALWKHLHAAFPVDAAAAAAVAKAAVPAKAAARVEVRPPLFQRSPCHLLPSSWNNKCSLPFDP